MNGRPSPGRAGDGPAWLMKGFRPFFLGAAAWSAAALGLWAAMLTLGLRPPSRFDPLSWHIHEMLFGFVFAAVAGFLLTAIPNWTGRPPVRGAPLAVLAGLWILGRVDCLVSALLPAQVAVTADMLFPAALAAVVARELIAGRNWRNLRMLAPVAALGIANLLMHLESLGVRLPAGLGWRLGLAGVLVLVSVVGGRIIPSFTRNWLVKRGEVAADALSHGWADRAALASLHAGLFAWVAFPASRAVGALLLAAAAANLWRLVRWRGLATVSEPLLLVLHLGYAWLAVGAALLGASLIDPRIPMDGGVHALTAGAIGTMILAVMTRATRGHTGRSLTADPLTMATYVLVVLAALVRIAASFATGAAAPLILAAATLWVSAFVLFAVGYAPMLLGARRAA